MKYLVVLQNGTQIEVICPICKIRDFVHYKLRIHVDNKKGIANINQYRCTQCNHLLLFNMPLTPEDEVEFKHMDFPY